MKAFIISVLIVTAFQTGFANKENTGLAKDPAEIVDFILKNTQSKVQTPAEKVIGDKNFILRGDYSNSRIQFEKNRKGHVAFIGGSITEMNGYRPIVCEMLKKRFPETAFTFTNAGIGSTCSDTGAFRMGRDVLSKGPVDMLFVEFAVNDDQDGGYSRQRCIRGMEGIIAQARKHNPNVDIVITHFVNGSILKKLKKGEAPISVQAHSDVAEQHGVSVNNLAQELADLTTAGKVDWKTFGGVHPKKYGNTMCAAMISNALLDVWSKHLAAGAKISSHKLVSLLDPKSYSRGRFLDVSAVAMDETWQVSVPRWKEDKIAGLVRPRFQQSPLIHSSTVGGKLKVSFSGTAIGAYVLSGPDAALIRCSIDGKLPVEIDPLHRHSGFHYPQTIMFFDDLKDGEHVMELEILDNRSGRRRKGGTAFRALHFTAN
ncbi:putative O-antigen related protein [Lentisphaera araneosa HTCC2155]|uniref:Putative O-antigen related protein n=1 Tax=Lentisphaera araneosa HTCC2155 TaxID=313628 RepID=A6DIF0_9BACT|nr:GDSL-type esterase/lipase family protein [Lentisphaera araneosa]EDM28804.1 putative O-antigen related protein [Lentisphaera araneosa HTCC2155]